MKRVETDVARPIVAWLTDLQWDVYQEVGGSGKRCDIVGRQGPLLWAIEVKTTLTFDVLEQAENWLDHAHYVSVAVPWSRSHRSMAKRFCRHLGIGILEMDDRSPGGVRECLEPQLGRRRVVPHFAERLRNACLPECKTWGEAGNANADFYSPFKGTCKAVVDYLKLHGPSPVRDVVAGIKHHYHRDSTARSCIPRWAQHGKIRGVKVDWSTRPARLCLDEKSA